MPTCRSSAHCCPYRSDKVPAAAGEHAREDWEQRVREEWSGLKIGYAVALDRQEPIPTARAVAR